MRKFPVLILLLMGIAGLPPVVAPHKAGKIRILAVTSAKRSSALPAPRAVKRLTAQPAL